MAEIDRKIMVAFEAMEKSGKDLADAKQNLKKLMDEREVDLKEFETDHSYEQAERVVNSDSNYFYLMMLYSRAYYDTLSAHSLVCHVLNADSKYEEEIKKSREKVGQSSSNLDAISFDYDDTKDKLLESDPDDGKFSQENDDDDIYLPKRRITNGSSYWEARKTDVRIAEDSFARVIEEEKNNKDFLKNIDKEFDKFLAENYPMLRRQPGSSAD